MLNSYKLWMIGLCLMVSTVAWAAVEVNVVDFGAKAGDGSDTTLAVRKALEKCRLFPEARLVFPKGRYDFWPDMAQEKYYFISNNDEGLKRIAFPVLGFESLEIDGQGAEFMFHGYLNPFVVEDSKNITLRNFSIDFERTFHSEAKILGYDDKGMDVEIPEQFPYEIDNHILVFTDGRNRSERKTTTTSHKVFYPFSSLLEFDVKRRETAFKAHDFWVGSGLSVEDLGNRRVRLIKPGLKGTPGNILVFGSLYRKVPGFTLTDSVGLNLENINIYHCGGMGVIGQRSGDIRLHQVNVTPPPGSGRIISVTADATHYVNCFGKIEMSHCLFENQKDDPSNIHGIYAKVVQQLAPNEIVVQLVHAQQFGFDFIQTGKDLELVHGPSLITYGQAHVKGVERYNKEFTRVVLTDPLPDEFELGDAVAEIRDYPELHIHHCKMRGNRARGFLLNCRGKTVIEDNIFNVPGTALLFEGDARFWFEQAGVRDCVIRNNLFDNCNYGVWGRATIEVAAGIEETYRAKSRYNRNILIEGNTFRCYDHYPVLKAYSVDGLVFRNNTIEYTNEYPSQNLNLDTFEITDCDNVLIEK
jgi:hypothetical protein